MLILRGLKRFARFRTYPGLAAVLVFALDCGPNQEWHHEFEQGAAHLTPQRVTAAVKKQARTLVRVETEHGELITTPEHPFAKLGAGWVPAASLRPGDLMVSARAGAVRVRTIRSTSLATPEPVFNLTVAPSHAYVVGTASVLVHNTDCGRRAASDEELTRQLEEAKAEYLRLKETAPSSPEHAAEIERRKRELEALIRRLWRNVGQRAWRRGEAPLPRLELFNKPGEKLQSDFEAARRTHEAKETELASAVSEQRELERREPNSPREREDWEKRKQDLKKRIAQLRKALRSLSRELQGAREHEEAVKRLHEIDAARPTSEQQRQALQEERGLLREKIRKLGDRATQRRHDREIRAKGSERRERVREYKRRGKRTAPYVADQDRPRDLLERIEEELEQRERDPDARDQTDRVEHLRERAADLRRAVEIRRELGNLDNAVHATRLQLEEARARSRDSSQLERRMAELEERRGALRSELRRLRAQEILRGNLEAAGWLDEPTAELDESRLREFEQRLTEREPLDERALEDIERALSHEDGPVDPALLAQMEQDFSRELEAQREPLLEDLRTEMQDVDGAARELAQELQLPPSPERRSSIEQSLHRLRDELTDERRAFEANDFALANEYAFLDSTLQRPGGSSAQGGLPTALQRINEERMKLRLDWRARMQGRLDDARRQLRDVLRFPAFRDDELEAELHAHVALLEHELERGP